MPQPGCTRPSPEGTGHGQEIFSPFQAPLFPTDAIPTLNCLVPSPGRKCFLESSLIPLATDQPKLRA